MRIVQISDSHISVDVPQRARDLEVCIDAINSLSVAADLVVHTGDVAHDASSSEYNTAKQILDRLDAPYMVLPGNRDRRAALAQCFEDHLRMLDGTEYIQYLVARPDMNLVFVDTVSSDSNKGRLCTTRLSHVETMLAADSAKMALVFMHHTPFFVDVIPDPQQFEDWKEVEQLQTVFARHKHIYGVYCGHVHRNVDGQLGDLQISALSCLARDLRKGQLSDDEKQRPMFRSIDVEIP